MADYKAAPSLSCQAITPARHSSQNHPPPLHPAPYLGSVQSRRLEAQGIRRVRAPCWQSGRCLLGGLCRCLSGRRGRAALGSSLLCCYYCCLPDRWPIANGPFKSPLYTFKCAAAASHKGRGHSAPLRQSSPANEGCAWGEGRRSSLLSVWAESMAAFIDIYIYFFYCHAWCGHQ